MEGLEIRSITITNLPDLVTPIILAGTLQGGHTLESEDAAEMTRTKLAFFHDRMRYGASAMAAYRSGRPVGVLEYYPIEVAPVPVKGNDLFAINTMEVPAEEGREEIEKELVAACVKHWSSRKGVVALGRGEGWDSLGFEQVAQDVWPEGDELTLWLMKFWEVEEPRLVPVGWSSPAFKGKVRVDVFDTGSCPWNVYVGNLVARVAEDMGASVILERTDCEERDTVLKLGFCGGVALNGKFMPWLRPHPAPTEADVRKAIQERL